MEVIICESCIQKGEIDESHIACYEAVFSEILKEDDL